MYNVELFNMFDNTFVDHFLIGDDIDFGVDYIAPRTIDVKAPANISIDLKNTVRVFDADRDILVYVGFVQSFSREVNRTDITLAPLMMLLNEVSMQNIADEQNNQNWRYQIYAQIYWDFMQANPSLYRIPWVYWSGQPISNWGNETRVGYGAELKNDMDCIISRAKAKGLYMRFALYTSGNYLGRPSFSFYPIRTKFTIEADLENVIERKITETTKEGYNVAIIWYPTDNAGSYTNVSRAIINGVIVYGYSARLQVENPRLIEKVLDHAPDNDEQVKLFASMLQVGSDNVEIELTFKRGDRLVEPYWSLGRPATIITSNKTYETYCTGYSRKGDLLTLKFGTVRQDLTDILNREGN